MNADHTYTPALLEYVSPATHLTRWARQAFGGLTTGRGKRVVYLLVAVWMLNGFDAALTIRAQADGVLFEQNPLARHILGLGAPAILAFKVALVAGASYVLFTYRRLRCSELATAVILVVYVGVAFQWQLCYDMYELAYSDGTGHADFARVDALIRYFPIL